MQQSAHKCTLIVLVRDRSTGRVRIDRDGAPLVDYLPGRQERAQLRLGRAQPAVIHRSPPSGAMPPSGYQSKAGDAEVMVKRKGSPDLGVRHQNETGRVHGRELVQVAALEAWKTRSWNAVASCTDAPQQRL